jgi:DNA-binding winged helix-turn-helix (wHTH) protein
MLLTAAPPQSGGLARPALRGNGPEMTDSPEVALRFEMLGPVRAYRGAEPVDLGPPRQQAVLAILLLHAGTPVPMRQLIAALWNGDPPENGIDVVQRYVGALRRALDPQRTSLIALTDGGYVLRADEQAVDTGQFRAALARARAEHRAGTVGAATGEVRDTLTQWPEQPLAGLAGPVFESARARLRQERATAAELLSQPTRLEPSSAKPAAERPDLAPTRPEPISTNLTAGRPDPDPAHASPSEARPAYPEPIDPWAGHELFPPDPMALG